MSAALADYGDPLESYQPLKFEELLRSQERYDAWEAIDKEQEAKLQQLLGYRVQTYDPNSKPTFDASVLYEDDDDEDMDYNIALPSIEDDAAYERKQARERARDEKDQEFFKKAIIKQLKKSGSKDDKLLIDFLKPKPTGIRKFFGGLKKTASAREQVSVKPSARKPLPVLPKIAEVQLIHCEAAPDEYLFLHETEVRFPALAFPPPIISPTQGSIDHIVTRASSEDSEDDDETMYDDISIEDDEALQSPNTILQQIEFPQTTENNTAEAVNELSLFDKAAADDQHTIEDYFAISAQLKSQKAPTQSLIGRRGRVPVAATASDLLPYMLRDAQDGEYASAYIPKIPQDSDQEYADFAKAVARRQELIPDRIPDAVFEYLNPTVFEQKKVQDEAVSTTVPEPIIGRKRTARGSFVTKSIYNKENVDSNIAIKKPRLSPVKVVITETSSMIIEEDANEPSPTFSLIKISGSSDDEDVKQELTTVTQSVEEDTDGPSPPFSLITIADRSGNDEKEIKYFEPMFDEPVEGSKERPIFIINISDDEGPETPPESTGTARLVKPLVNHISIISISSDEDEEELVSEPKSQLFLLPATTYVPPTRRVPEVNPSIAKESPAPAATKTATKPVLTKQTSKPIFDKPARKRRLPGHVHNRSRNFFPDPFKALPLPVTGFAGQFHPLPTLMRPHHAAPGLPTPRASKPIIFGSQTHANGIIAHTNPHPDSLSGFFNLHQDTLPEWHPLIQSIKHASDTSHHFSSGMHRRASKEHMRKQAHLECALARLENVCVGEYRYYQGHMSVEEYIEAGICVCWAGCQCTKICNRNADVICACAYDKEIVLQGD